MLLPVLLLPGLAWGAAGRLRPVWYPASWLAAARLVNASPARGAALVLPWTAYRRPGWNHRETVLDPWPRLLGRTVLWNDGGQVGRVQLAPDDAQARRLAAAITGTGPLTRTFSAAGVRFVIVDASSASPAVVHRLAGCQRLVRQARPGRFPGALTPFGHKPISRAPAPIPAGQDQGCVPR